MLIQLSEILLQEGKTETFNAEIEMDSICFRLGEFKIVDKMPLTLQITNVGDRKLEIEGTGRLVVDIPCDRCLENVPTVFDLHIQQKLDMKQSEEERVKDLDESNFITQTELDVDQLVYDEVLIEWPLKVLCKEDCKGICSQCGANLNHETCSCEHTERLDPRMAAIRDIFSKFKEV
ncbi:MAG: DUF177 domain-containing protein [Clostridia bacterium]|nr:DUF177 domain-containing protein [Clostridia bacterium]MDY5554074.1 DUF177 domain-containing protein [Blautia sp.]